MRALTRIRLRFDELPCPCVDRPYRLRTAATVLTATFAVVLHLNLHLTPDVRLHRLSDRGALLFPTPGHTPDPNLIILLPTLDRRKTLAMTVTMKVIYGCDLGTLHKKLELGNLPAKEMKKVGKAKAIPRLSFVRIGERNTTDEGVNFELFVCHAAAECG